MRTEKSQCEVGLSAKVGAWLFVLWGVLHIWVGAEGVRQYITVGTPGLWGMVIGGPAVPLTGFVHPRNPALLGTPL